MSPRVSFARAARAFLTARVRVTHGGSVIADDLPFAIQPRTSYESATITGRFTDATLYGYCKALDSNGAKLRIRKGCKVEELVGNTVKRLLEVTDDPENYLDVFLLVPLRPRRMGE